MWPHPLHTAAKGCVSSISSIFPHLLHLLAHSLIHYLLLLSSPPLPSYLQSVSLSAPRSSTAPTSIIKPNIRPTHTHTQKNIFGNHSLFQFSVRLTPLCEHLALRSFFNQHSNDLRNAYTRVLGTEHGLEARPHPSQRRATQTVDCNECSLD